MLTTLGFVALLIGVVLVVCGYTVAPQALRPGWGAVILGVVLILLGYVMPALVVHDDYDTATPLAAVTLHR